MYDLKKEVAKRLSGDRGSSDSLLSSEDEKDCEYHDVRTLQPRPPSRWRPIAFHSLIVLTYTAVFLVLLLHLPAQKNCHEDMIYTPARSAVQYVRKPSTNTIGNKSPYAGYPSPEVDEAWKDLLKYSNIKVSEDTLRKMNRSSIQLQDGSGMYAAGLGVHHHLHCIKSVRRVIYRDYYNLTDEPMMWMHLDHCLEDIRLSLMCNPDISILTYDWLPNYKRPWGNWDIDGECVDWEKLNGWAGENAYSLFDQKSLVHPELGLSYPMEDGKLNQDSRIHPSGEDVASIMKGTNPKGNWGPGP